MELNLQVNGAPRHVTVTSETPSLDLVVVALDLHPGRVAIEHNGDIVPRTKWAQCAVANGDKLEVVHFVAGGKL